MELKVQAGDIANWKGDGIVVNLFEGVKTPAGATAAVDNALGGTLTKLIEKGDIKGKLGSATIVHTLDRLPADRVCVAGLGRPNELSLDRVRQATANGAKALRNSGAKAIATTVHSGIGGLDLEGAAQATAEGLVL